jgi:hypothetical protein
MRKRGRRYWYWDNDERLVFIQQAKLRVFGAGFIAGIAASVGLLGLVALYGCL